MKLRDFFTGNLPAGQRQYEAVRAVAFDEAPLPEIASRFHYSPNSLRALVYRVLHGSHQLFPILKPGPKKRRTPPDLVKLIVRLRREQKINSRQIVQKADEAGFSIAVRTVERILSDAGFPKLHRRTNEQRGISRKGLLIPERAEHLDLETLEPFTVSCPVAGVFFFLPYILQSGLLDIVQQCPLPDSSVIGKTQAALAMLLLKLLGHDRLSHVHAWDADPAFGLFAGLTILPKATYMGTYSCRAGQDVLETFQTNLVRHLRKVHPELYQDKTINLDFHSIPHFGDEAHMENVWCGARGKSMKGANTFFAQDADSDQILYSRADIRRSESSREISRFVTWWASVKGVVDQTLVFDSKLTSYGVLYELADAHIKFITLRRRSKTLIEETLKIPDDQWQRVHLPIPKRKYQHVRVHESRVELIEKRGLLRQLIIKDHGRAEPTFVVTSDEQEDTKEILVLYARRWHIENKLAELIKFFSLNSLSSPIMIRIHFDILWTIVADTLYHLFARDLRRFETALAPQIFRRFVNMPGLVSYDGKAFTVKIRKRAVTPILMGLEKLKGDIQIPWLGGKPLRIRWTA